MQNPKRRLQVSTPHSSGVSMAGPHGLHLTSHCKHALPSILEGHKDTVIALHVAVIRPSQ